MIIKKYIKIFFIAFFFLILFLCYYLSVSDKREHFKHFSLKSEKREHFSLKKKVQSMVYVKGGFAKVLCNWEGSIEEISYCFEISKVGVSIDAAKNMFASNKRRTVHIEVNSFYVDKYEVSMAEYYQCVEAGHCTPLGEREFQSELDDYCEIPSKKNILESEKKFLFPAQCVDPTQAIEYCKWRGKRLMKWYEYDYLVESWSRFDYQDKYGYGYGYASPRGSNDFDVNKYGVHDLYGNVYEWVSLPIHDSEFYFFRGVNIGSERPSTIGAYQVFFIDYRNSNPRVLNGFRCAKDAEREEIDR